ncbi:uncharacterized protein LOC136090969 [Hydra vulgaris]|uniref:Uncharacterized protein LOC136090969 n=1 Tax=Hydra vulgaris TaxID=6087 RepID=A0ABM4DHQ4_HYDVU
MSDSKPKTEVKCTVQFITRDKEQKKLENLDGNKTIGIDGVHPKLLKVCAVAFAVPYTLIFQTLFSKGKVPDDLKRSSITPIFKKDSKLNASNYRPVSLTSIPCKVMDCFVRDQILNHCIINGLILKKQHGFVFKKLCLANLLETLDLLKEGINN